MADPIATAGPTVGRKTVNRVQIVDNTQPFGDFCGPPARSHNEELALTGDWLGTTTICFIAARAALISQPVHIGSEPGNVWDSIADVLSIENELLGEMSVRHGYAG